ncbi:MAG TPA: hypothetical protein PKM95_04885, partial [Deltaproteobacteria bacterium]|nr:hypothetical protein [Deltaproteobacteria bacterium]
RTGFNYANLGPNAPTFTNSEIAATGKSYAGFYLGNNGRWYPIDQSKVGKKGKGGGKSGGG